MTGKTGRPTLYTDELGQKIAELMAEGMSARKIAQRDDMPSRQTLDRWIDSIPAFAAICARAREAQADYMADKIVEESYAATPADVQVAKLRVDTLKWLAARLAPKKYGDSTTLKGDAENPLAVAVSEIARRVIDAKPDA
jgi:hypothetical protein